MDLTTTAKSGQISGRLWILRDAEGTLIDDIDTDMIFHNRYLHITDLKEMGPYTLDNLAGWKDFAKKAQPGDIVMAGRNFGAGSSRQQAVDCFRALGIRAIIAESFGAIYKRNAINSGMPLLSVPKLTEQAAKFNGAGPLTIDLKSGVITRGANIIAQAQPFSQVQMDIYQAGDLFAYGRHIVNAQSEEEKWE